MKIAVFGTGLVGNTIATKLIQLGHAVMMGARTADNDKAAEWVNASGPQATQGTFADAAKFGELLFNCTAGAASLEALQQAGAENMRGKILVDLANPLVFDKGMPVLTVSNTDSLGEQIQRTFPEVKVVKTLNTINCEVMVNPAMLPGEHDIFVGGNDAAAKAEVTTILKDWFGWQSVIDLGDITSARATEQYLPFWLRLMGTLGTVRFNIKIVR